MHGKKITLETMRKIWTLHHKGVDDVSIASVLGTSPSSVKRATEILQYTEKGEFEALERYCKGNYKDQRKYAREILNIPEEKRGSDKEEKKPENVTVDTNGTTYLLEVLELLREQNTILKRCLSELGVEV